MKDNNLIPISGKILKWARTTYYGGNIDEPVSKLKISLTQLKDWEENGASISVVVLKRICKVYKRHPSVMLLEVPPVSQEPPKFRTLSNFENSFLDKKTFFAIRQAQEIQQRSIYMRENIENQFIKNVKENSTKNNNYSQIVSKLLGIEPDTRFKSKTSREQLIMWKRKLQSVGVIVSELSFPVSDARGFVLYDKIAPFIVLNSKDTDNGRIFTLFHELGHIILGQSDIDMEISLSIKQSHVDETFCNKFAASFLVPTDLIVNYINGNEIFNDEYVKKLANKFKVSVGVIWRRLRDSQLVDKKQLMRVADKLSIFEPFVVAKTGSKFMANKNTHLYTTIKRKSELYISEVFEAFGSKKITYFEMVDYIGIKPESLPRLQQLMYI